MSNSLEKPMSEFPSLSQTDSVPNSPQLTKTGSALLYSTKLTHQTQNIGAQKQQIFFSTTREVTTCWPSDIVASAQLCVCHCLMFCSSYFKYNLGHILSLKWFISYNAQKFYNFMAYLVLLNFQKHYF